MVAFISVIFLLALLSEVGEVGAQPQSSPVRRADQVDSFFIYGGHVDRAAYNPNRDYPWRFTRPDTNARYRDFSPWLDTLGMNALYVNFWDYPCMLNDTLSREMPLELVKHGPVVRGVQSFDNFKYAVHHSAMLTFGLANASYIRVEAERHPHHSFETDYPGFLEDGTGRRGLVGKNIKDPQASNSLWLNTRHPEDTATNAIKLIAGVDRAGVFADSLWHYNFLKAPVPKRNATPRDRGYGSWSHQVTNQKLLSRFRVRLDTAQTWPQGGAPRVFAVRYYDAYNKTQAIDTFYADADFKHRDVDFDTLLLRFWPVGESRSIRAELRWFGEVSMTIDWIDFMTASVEPTDNQDSLLYDNFGMDWVVPCGYALGAEDWLTDNNAKARALIDTLCARFEDNVAYFDVPEECHLGQMYALKRAMRMVQERVGDKIQFIMLMHDSSDQHREFVLNPYIFYSEGVRLGWLDSSKFADPKMIAMDPYFIGYKCPMPRRIASTDYETVYEWNRKHVSASVDSSGRQHALPYTRDSYREALKEGYKEMLRAHRSAQRSTQRNPRMKFGSAIQTGAAPNHVTVKGHGSRYAFGAGLRPPTGAELKMMTHLTVSLGAAFIQTYTLLNGRFQQGNGGLMDWNADHSANLLRYMVTHDSNYHDIWFGFKERFDTARSVFPIAIKYGSELIKCKFERDFFAHEYNSPDALPFVANSIRSYDSLGVQDAFSTDEAKNRTDVHISIWCDTTSGDTLLYITNLRTDDSYVPGDTICGRQDYRLISMQMKGHNLVGDVLDTAQTRTVGKIRTPYVSASDRLTVWLSPGEGVLVRLLPLSMWWKRVMGLI